jgi:hypothetical protein
VRCAGTVKSAAGSSPEHSDSGISPYFATKSRSLYDMTFWGYEGTNNTCRTLQRQPASLGRWLGCWTSLACVISQTVPCKHEPDHRLLMQGYMLISKSIYSICPLDQIAHSRFSAPFILIRRKAWLSFRSTSTPASNISPSHHELSSYSIYSLGREAVQYPQNGFVPARTVR